jgi:hypothetical protein
VIAGLWSLAAWAAAEPRCEKVGIKDLVPEETGPAIVVLGERPGVTSDLDRLRSFVKALSKRGPVTLAVQELPREPGTEEPTPEVSQRRLVLSEIPATHTVPIGVPIGERKPVETPLAVPPLYIHPLADAMGEGKMPPELEPRFVEQVAWIDHQLAAGAMDGWDQAGFLVILVDRLHVQGGLGVAWQTAQMTEIPVHQALLANAGTQCVDADWILKSPLLPIF